MTPEKQGVPPCDPSRSRLRVADIRQRLDRGDGPPRGYRALRRAGGGADSIDLLREAYAQVRAAGYGLVGADCVLIGQEPRIAPRRDAIRARLASALAAGPKRVNVRAIATDRIGFTVRGEGLAAEAAALLEAL